MTIRTLCFIILIGLPFLTKAQKQALFIFTIKGNVERLAISDPKLLSDFVKDGKLSDPYFIANNKLLVTHIFETGSDIYRMDLDAGTLLRLTRTPDLEFCPRSKPAEPAFTCLIKDSIPSSKTSLWSYPEDLKNGGREVYSDRKPWLSYCWLKDSLIAAVTGGQMPELYFIETANLSSRLISGKVNPCIKKTQNSDLFYLYQYDDLHWFIKKINPESGEIGIVKKGPVGGDVFDLLNDESIIMGAKDKLYVLQPDINDWVEVADLSIWGIKNIIQMEYNGLDKIAVTAIMAK